MSNITSSRAGQRESIKPVAEILVEGELSPFEHEALYQLIKKHFLVKQPAYSELEDETVATRVSLIFHHSYDREFFTEIFERDWQGLKNLFKQISYRRGRLGASFNLSFNDQRYRLTFSTGVLEDQALGSAMDQLAHLTGVIGMMMRPVSMPDPLEKIVISFDSKSDRWGLFQGFDKTGKKEYSFDEALFRWVSLVHPE